MTTTNFTGWPDGRRGAVALTYDDALLQHADHVVPDLDDAALRATFYLPINGEKFASRIDAWRAAAARGHELGNHSLFHPCRRDAPGEQAWMAEEYNLATYTEKRWREEMSVADLVLNLVDGRDRRTFGNTCCDEHIGPDRSTSLHPLIDAMFPAARGPLNSRLVDPRAPTFAGLGHFSGDSGTLAGTFAPILDAATREGKLAIFMIHGVGPGEHGLFVEAREHAALLAELSRRVAGKSLWVAPLIDVVEYLRRAHRASDSR